MAREPDFVIKRGLTLPAFPVTLGFLLGGPIPLAGATVRFRMHRPGEPEDFVVDRPGLVTDAALSEVQFDWGATDTDTAGTFHAHWLVEYAGGAMKVPARGFLKIVVES